MRLTAITVSGANEFTDIKALLRICEKYPLAEIGVQVSGDKAAFGMARYWWIWALCFYATPMTQIALHLNKDWVEDFCVGNVPPELKTFLDFRHENGAPIISRVQLNFKIGREKTPDAAQVAGTANLYQYWGDRLAEEVYREGELVLNLASVEYAKAIKPYLTPARQLVTCLFGEVHAGKFKQKATQAKQARGNMVRYLAEHQVTTLAGVKKFAVAGFQYQPVLSTPTKLVFVKA